MTNTDTFDTRLTAQIAALDTTENEAWKKWQATRSNGDFSELYEVAEKHSDLLRKSNRASNPDGWILTADTDDLETDIYCIKNDLKYVNPNNYNIQALIDRLIARSGLSYDVINGEFEAWRTSLESRRDAIYVETKRRKLL